jgi:cellulase/cellobiase CelA1
MSAIVVATLAIFLAQWVHASGSERSRAGGAPTPARSPATSPSDRPGCSASFTVAGAWPTGFQANVTVRGNGSSPVNGWTVTWTFPSDQTVMQMWNGRYTQTKSIVTVQSEGWNRSPAAGNSTTFGFVGTGNAPTAVHDLTCTVAGGTGVPSPSRR